MVGWVLVERSAMWELVLAIVVVALALAGLLVGAMWLMGRVLDGLVRSVSEVFRSVLSPPEVVQPPESAAGEMFLPPWERLDE